MKSRRCLCPRTTTARRLPFQRGARHIDLVRHHERRIEADAESSDQRGLVLLSLPVLLGFDAVEKSFGARARDGAERLGHFLTAHADAVVLHCQALPSARRKRYARFEVVAQEFRLGDPFVTSRSQASAALAISSRKNTVLSA